MQATAEMHVFELNGLGKPPYRYIGFEGNDDREAVNRELEASGMMFTTNHTTSCDFCHTGICDAYRFESADGKRFKVGCECVKKAGDAGILNAIKEDKKKNDRKVRHAREQRQLAEGREFVEQNAAALSAIPHPKAWAAEKGQTFLDYVRWYEKNAGTAGKLETYRYARKVMES